MKWMKISSAILSVMLLSASGVFAQEAPPPPPGPPMDHKEKQEEIIIRKRDGRAEKMTIVVDGDKVTVNGKSMDDFKDGNVTIIKRDRRPGPGGGAKIRTFAAPHPDMGDDNIEEESIERMMPPGINKAMLGVMSEKVSEGVKITEVTKESGAEKAGLQKDDVITKVGNTKVSDTKELTEAISKYKPEDKVDITFKRNGKETKATATLTANRSKRVFMRLNGNDFDFDMPEGVMPPEIGNFDFNFERKPRIGLQIQDVEEGKGVQVKDVDDESPAAKAGLKEQDIITQVNGKEVNGVDDLSKEIKQLKEGDIVKITYRRDGKSQTTEVKLPKRLKTVDL